MVTDKILVVCILTGFFFLHTEFSLRCLRAHKLVFKIAENMAATFKMADDKNVVFCISTGFFCMQHLLDVGSNLVNFALKMATNVVTNFKMATDQNVASCISTGFLV